MREVKWYTQETYYRLMAADVLPEEDKIVYLDCDIVVLEDVAHLYAVDMGDALLGAVLADPPSAQRMSEILGVPIGRRSTPACFCATSPSGARSTFTAAAWRRWSAFRTSCAIRIRTRSPSSAASASSP